MFLGEEGEISDLGHRKEPRGGTTQGRPNCAPVKERACIGHGIPCADESIRRPVCMDDPYHVQTSLPRHPNMHCTVEKPTCGETIVNGVVDKKIENFSHRDEVTVCSAPSVVDEHGIY